MTDHRFASRDRLDEPVVHALRDLLAPPGGDGYWTELEDTIMSRLDTMDLGWWGELTRLARPALIAAAVLVMTATAALVRASQADSSAMYESVAAAGAPASLPEALTVRPIAQGEREATLRYLLAP